MIILDLLTFTHKNIHKGFKTGNIMIDKIFMCVPVFIQVFFAFSWLILSYCSDLECYIKLEKVCMWNWNKSINMFFYRVTVYAIAFGGLLLNKVSISHIIYSVADPGCLSRIPDPTFFHPGSRIRTVSIPDLRSRIPDPHQRI